MHRRSVLLDRASRSIDIIDEIEGGRHELRLAFHLGPDVQVELNEASAPCWAGPRPARAGSARLELPLGLQWSLHRGETDPILGWYSPGLGRRVPAFSLVGQGRCEAGRAARHPAGVPRARRFTQKQPSPAGHIMGCA